ncbi:MAG: cyclic nucleotide-binding/CBS domain-containing protein [Candidatus Heimdallarchaeota archaeon]
MQVYTGNELLLNSVEIKGVDEDTKTLTLILAAQDLPKCLGKEITQIIALPRTKETLLVEDLMTRQVYTVGPEASIRAAISLMNRYRVSSVVVMKNDKPIGILTDRSFLQQIGKNRLVDLRLTKVRTLMSTPLVEISPEASVDDALTVIRNKHIKKLPVTSKGKLVGIITSNDILRLRH